jgi:O-antigen/teichoic acid export membrane protein
MIACAWVRPSVWALVIGSLSGTLVRMILTHSWLRAGHYRIRWSPSAAAELVRFGRWVFLSTLATFFAAQVDRLVLGRLLSIQELGVYSIAVMFAMLPSQLALRVCASVLMPALSESFRSGADVMRAFRKARDPLMMLGGLGASMLIGAGAPVLTAMYDDRYASAGWMLRLLALGLLFQIPMAGLGAFMLATGHASAVAIANATKLVASLVLIVVGWRCAGIGGAIAAGIVGGEAAKYAVMHALVRRQYPGIESIRWDIMLTIAIGAFAGFSAETAVYHFDAENQGASAVCAVLSVGIVWLPCLVSASRRHFGVQCLVPSSVDSAHE